VKRFLEWGLILVVVLSVLDFGGVTPLGYTLMEGIIFLLFIILLFRQTRSGRINLPLPLALCVLLLWVLLQVAPVPRHFVEWCSPARALFSAGSRIIGHPGWTTLSIYPHQTLLGLAKLLAYAAAFGLAAWTYGSQERKSALIRALILLGCFESAYGIVQYTTGFQKIFTYTKRAYLEEATGTYINHNHFAGFLELVLPWIVAQIYFLLRPKGSLSPSAVSRAASSRFLASRQAAYFYVVLVVLILLGIVFSRSRMGIVSALLSLLFMAAVAQVKEKNKALVGITLVVLGASLTYAAWIGLGPIMSRYEELERGGITTEGRLGLWKSGLHIIRNNPLFGTGLGTFEYAFTPYQDNMVQLKVAHLHNDYLEFTCDLGLPGVVLLFVPILYLLAKMIAVLAADRSRYRRSVLLGCIGSVVALLIHSLVDFNLQIPANALVFAIILGVGYKAACLEPRASYVLIKDEPAPVSRAVNGGKAGSAQIRPA
jgi:O-antigen ligase